MKNIIPRRWMIFGYGLKDVVSVCKKIASKVAELSAARQGHFGDTEEANFPMSTRRLCLRVDIGAIPKSHPSLGNAFFL